MLASMVTSKKAGGEMIKRGGKSMKTYRKILVGICGVAALGCVVMASVNISSEEVSAATVTV